MDRETAIIADEGFCSNLKSPVPAGCEGQSNPKYCPLGHLSPPRSELHFGRDCQPPCCLLKLDPQLLELTYGEFKSWSKNREIDDGILVAAKSTAPRDV